jgi:hypothetical protein
MTLDSRSWWRIALGGAVLITAGLLVLAPASAVYALAFLGAVLYAVHTGHRHDLSLERTVRSGVLLVTAASLALPAVVGLIGSSYHVTENLLRPDAAFRTDLTLTLLASAGLVVAARAWPDRFGDRTFVLLTVVLAVVAKLAYVWAVQADAVSDFEWMWRVASWLTDQGLDATRRQLKPFSWPHFERILPFLFPMRILFGSSPAAYAIPNVLLGAVTSLLTWRLTRRWFGRTAARVALVVSLAAVETVLIAEIPSHELPGAFYTLLSLTLFQIAWDFHAQGRHRAALLAGAALGLSILVLDFQRSTGSVMLLSTFLLGFGIAAVGGRFWRGLPVVLVPLLVFVAADTAARRAGLRIPPAMQAKSSGIGLAATTDSASDGSYLYTWHNYTVRYGASGVDWRRLALVKLASDTHYHPGARLSLYLRKARTLFPLGSQTYFYLPNTSKLHGVAMDDLTERIFVISLGFTVLFLATLLVALVRIWDVPGLTLTALAPLFFLATFSAILLLLAEVQPRYLYSIWYIGPIYIGALLGRSS